MTVTVSRGGPSPELRPRVAVGLTLSVTARIAARAAAAPDSVAVVDGASHLSYAELDQQSNQLAAHLRDAGAGAECCVGLLLERSAAFVVAALAVLKAGAAYLPLDSSTPADRAASILADAKAPLLLSHRGKSRDLPAGAWRAIDLDGPEAARIAACPTTPAGIEPLPDSLAYVVYTSGSTGRPKGVEITRENLRNLIDWHQAAFAVTAADRASQVAGLGFDATAWEIWPHLTAGASLHIADDLTRRAPLSLRDWLIAEQITIAFVPTVLTERLLRIDWPPQTALRTLLTGADTLHRRPPAGLPFVLINNYGPTECTVVATSGAISPDSAAGAADQTPSIGRPIGNTTALILDDKLQPVGPGEPGELCLAGALVGRGYRHQPELTASRFVKYSPPSGPAMRLYRTGDRARLLPDGQIAFLGRLDEQVKIRGYRVEPGEIAACLDGHPGIVASAVVVRDGAGDNGAADAALVAYVVAATGAELTAAGLREFLGTRLPDYMIPAHYVVVAALPLTPNGKLDKSALPAPDAANLLPNRAGPAPAADAASDLERRVAALVAALLNQPSVHRDDNFFMLGGHSMLGVQLVAKIRDTFGVKLSLRQLFGAPTVAGLSAEVARLATSGPIAKA